MFGFFFKTKNLKMRKKKKEVRLFFMSLSKMKNILNRINQFKIDDEYIEKKEETKQNQNQKQKK